MDAVTFTFVIMLSGTSFVTNEFPTMSACTQHQKEFNSPERKGNNLYKTYQTKCVAGKVTPEKLPELFK